MVNDKKVDYVSDLYLHDNQIKSVVIENVTALPDGLAGKIVYLTADVDDIKAGYYYHNGTAWIRISGKDITDALATRLSVVEAATGIGGGSAGESLADKITKLENAVGNETQGLVKKTTENASNIEANKTEIAKVKTTADAASAAATANTNAIGSDTIADSVKGRIKTLEGEMDTAQTDITALKDKVGTDAAGLVKDVAELQVIVSDETTGLVKKVADNTTAIGKKANAEDVYTKAQTDAEVKKATDAAAANTTAIEALQNAGYITKDVSDLTNYYKKTETLSQDEITSKISAAISSAYQVKGTKTYAELATAEKVNGYVYNVSDGFTYGGKTYPAGTNVVWVGDAATGSWDPLAGVTDLSAYSTSAQVDKKISDAIAAAGHASETFVNTELAKKVDKTITVNGHALSANVTVTAEDLGLENVDNTSDADKPVSTATQEALDGKVSKLVTKPTAGTYTKVAINAEGQVTGGQTLAAADIPDLTADKITDFAAKVKAVRFVQSYNVTGTSQVVEHNLGITYPQVSIYQGNSVVMATIEYTDENKITISGNIALGAITVVVSP